MAMDFRNVDVSAPMAAAVRDCRGVPSGMHRRMAGRGMRFHSHDGWRYKGVIKF